jgi:hypothetical protein
LFLSVLSGRNTSAGTLTFIRRGYAVTYAVAGVEAEIGMKLRNIKVKNIMCSVRTKYNNKIKLDEIKSKHSCQARERQYQMKASAISAIAIK